MAPSEAKACALSTPQAASLSLETMTGLSPEKLHTEENTSLRKKSKHIYTQVYSLNVAAAKLNTCVFWYFVMQNILEYSVITVIYILKVIFFING